MVTPLNLAQKRKDLGLAMAFLVLFSIVLALCLKEWCSFYALRVLAQSLWGLVVWQRALRICEARQL